MNFITSLPPDDLRCSCSSSKQLFIRLLVGASCRLLRLRCFCFPVQQLANYAQGLVGGPAHLFFREVLADPLCSLATAGIDCGAAVRVLEKNKLIASLPTGHKLLFVQYGSHTLPLSATTPEALKAQVSTAFSLTTFTLVLEGEEVSAERFAETRSGDLILAFTEPVVGVRLPDNSVSWVTMETPQEITQALALPRYSKLTYRGTVLSSYETLQSQFVPPWAMLELVTRFEQLLCIHRVGGPPLYLVVRTARDVLPRVLELDCSLPPDTKIYFTNRKQSRPPLYAVHSEKRVESDWANSEVWAVGPEYFQVKCILQAGTYSFYVKASDTVDGVKSALAAKLGTAKDCVEQLGLDGDGRTWAQCGISQDKVVYALCSGDWKLTIVGGSKPVTLIAAPSAKIHEVKQEIVSQLHLETSQFQLIYDHESLQNDYTIGDYNIPRIAEIRLLAKECEFVRFETTEGTKFSAALLGVDLAKLKATIKKHIGASPRCIWWIGEVRDDSAACDYAHLTLLCHRGPSSGVLYIHGARGKNYRLKVHPETLVAEVLRMISKKVNKPGWRLVLDNTVAEEKHTLSDYGFRDSATALLVSPEETVVRVLSVEANPIVLALGKEATLINVKTSLREVTGFQEEWQILSLGGAQEPDSTLLSTLGSNIELCLSINQRVIRVSTTSGVVGFAVEERDSVSDLLAAVSSRLSLPSASLRLFAQDIEVKAGQTLLELGLAQGGTMTLLTPSDHRVYIQSSLSKPFAVDVKETDRLKSVKLKVAQVLDVPLSQVRLIATVDVCGDRELELVRREANLLRLCVVPKRKQRKEE